MVRNVHTAIMIPVKYIVFIHFEAKIQIIGNRCKHLKKEHSKKWALLFCFIRYALGVFGGSFAFFADEEHANGANHKEHTSQDEHISLHAAHGF